MANARRQSNPKTRDSLDDFINLPAVESLAAELNAGQKGSFAWTSRVRGRGGSRQ